MTQQSTVTPTEAAPAAPAPELTTIDQRRAAILAEPAPSNESATDPKAAPAKDAAKPEPAAETDPAKRAEERRARLAALTSEERRKVDAKTRLAETDRLRAEHAAAVKRAEEIEARAAKLLDPDKLDEAAFFALAEQAKVTPEKLAEFLRSSIANPARVAAAAAAKQVDPQLAELKAKLAQSEARIEQFLSEQARTRQSAEEQAHEAGFVSFVKGSAGVAPHAARFAEKFGDGEFLKVARAAASTLREGAGPQALLDTIEEQLEQLSGMYAPAQPATPSKADAKNTPAKPTTVSNTNAQERASVVEDDEWSSLSLEERAARLRR